MLVIGAGSVRGAPWPGPGLGRLRVRRSALRADSPAMLGRPGRGITRCAACGSSAQTNAASQFTKRACPPAGPQPGQPALLGDAHAAAPGQAPTRAGHAVVSYGGDAGASASAATSAPVPTSVRPVASPEPRAFVRPIERDVSARRGWAARGDFGGGEKRRAGGGARAKTRALRDLTRRICLSGAAAGSAASYATRPLTEHRSGVDAQHRPPPSEPLAARPHRAAPTASEAASTRTTAKVIQNRTLPTFATTPTTRPHQ